MKQENAGYTAQTEGNRLVAKSQRYATVLIEVLPRTITCLKFHPHFLNVLVAAGDDFYSVFRLADTHGEQLQSGETFGTVNSITFDKSRLPNFTVKFHFSDRPLNHVQEVEVNL